MTDPGDHPPFVVAPDGTRFKVVDAEGKILMVCDNAANADQYAALMNQAFRRGYKAGYRHAKAPGR